MSSQARINWNLLVGTGLRSTQMMFIQGVPRGKVNILGDHGVGHSKQKCLYEHVSYSEPFPR